MALLPRLRGNALSVSSLSGMLALGLSGSPNTGPQPLLSLTLQGPLESNMPSLVELVLETPPKHMGSCHPTLTSASFPLVSGRCWLWPWELRGPTTRPGQWEVGHPCPFQQDTRVWRGEWTQMGSEFVLGSPEIFLSSDLCLHPAFSCPFKKKSASYLFIFEFLLPFYFAWHFIINLLYMFIYAFLFKLFFLSQI